MLRTEMAAHLSCWFCRVGRAWVDAHVEITKLFKTFGDLFDKLDGFMPFFDLM